MVCLHHSCNIKCLTTLFEVPTSTTSSDSGFNLSCLYHSDIFSTELKASEPATVTFTGQGSSNTAELSSNNKHKMLIELKVRHELKVHDKLNSSPQEAMPATVEHAIVEVQLNVTSDSPCKKENTETHSKENIEMQSNGNTGTVYDALLNTWKCPQLHWNETLLGYVVFQCTIQCPQQIIIFNYLSIL